MTELKRALGYRTILFLAISSIMGTGMFFGAAVGSSYSGNASIIAWIVVWLIAIYISMFFGELVALFPSAGGVYEYAKQSYGRFFSFIIGWIAWLVGNIGSTLLIVAAMDYLIPDPGAVVLKVTLSIVLILLLNAICIFGVEASGIVVIILSLLSISLILSVIIPGVPMMDVKNFSPFLSVGLLPIFATIFFISEAFFGWESTTYLAEETKNPEKVIPRALMIGTIVVGIFAVTISIVSLGIVPWQILSETTAPLSLVFEQIYGAFGAVLNYGVFIALIGSAAGGVVTLPRLILALARDKLFIAQLADIHPYFKTPYKAIIFQTIVGIIVYLMAIGEESYLILLNLTLPLGLVMYIFTILAIPILRNKYPMAKREFRVPAAGIGSAFLVIFLTSLIVAWLLLEPTALNLLSLAFSFVLVGIPIYFLLQIYYDPDVIIKTNDSLAYLTLLAEHIILPKRVRKEILTLLGDIQNKSILEFGCSVGTLTLDLAEHVKPFGKVIATDLSAKDLSITKKRVEKHGHKHVFVIHDEHQVNRVHPKIPNVDAIISIGMMGYLQDVKKVLREMRDLIPYNGKIVFVDYADFFKIIPNVAWLSKDETIEQLFREAGFSVFVTRKRGLLWNYVYVYGIKFHEDIAFI